MAPTLDIGGAAGGRQIDPLLVRCGSWKKPRVHAIALTACYYTSWLAQKIAIFLVIAGMSPCKVSYHFNLALSLSISQRHCLFQSASRKLSQQAGSRWWWYNIHRSWVLLSVPNDQTRISSCLAWGERHKIISMYKHHRFTFCVA